VFVLSYIQSRVCRSIEYSGTLGLRLSLYPSKVSEALSEFCTKILDGAVDEVSEALSTHVAPRAIWIIVVPTGVTVLLGLCNPSRS
jgi:hypothetical protein